MDDKEHIELMEQARNAVAAARLCGTASLKISEAMIWLELHRPLTAIKTLEGESR